MEVARAISEKVLLAYDQVMGNVESFKYIGILLTAMDYDWPVVFPTSGRIG